MSVELQVRRFPDEEARPTRVYLSVVIPAFNEGENVRQVVAETVGMLEKAPDVPSWELLIVDDGSTDETGSIASQIVQATEHVRVIHHPENRGLGAALKTGFLNSVGQWVTFIPGDGEVKVDQAVQLLQGARGAKLVVSTRTCAPGEEDIIRPLHRRVLTAGFQYMASAILGFDARGMQGIFVFRRELLDETQLYSQTCLLALELYMHCTRQNYSVHRGVMQASPRISGESKVANGRTIIKSFFDMFYVRLKHYRAGKRT